MATEAQPTIVPDHLIGKTIGNYIVRYKLGEGGMGMVYFAEHPSIGKRVALKVLHAGFASQPEIVSRFFHEAKAVNDIQHPNIVDIIDFGTIPPVIPTDPSVVYFLMEYIEGASLTDLITREAPLRPDRAVAIALQIADALSASHGKGIVHRDLKPDNVMLVPRGREHDFVKLLDFGIAKLTGNTVSTHRTRTGMVIGTPQYMSPEQCEGRGHIDHRTDIYALGIVLYQMLTGRVPFVGEGFGEVLVQQMATPPLAPSAIAPQIPEHLELVVLKALEKRADHRYPRMDDMTLALQDPAHYVEAHGGRDGFLTSQVLRDPAMAGPRAATAVFTALPGHAASTTLNGSTGQVAGTRPAKRRMSILVGLGLGLTIAVVGLAVGIAKRDGCGSFGTARTGSNLDRLRRGSRLLEHVTGGGTEGPPTPFSTRNAAPMEAPLLVAADSTIASCRLDAFAGGQAGSKPPESRGSLPSQKIRTQARWHRPGRAGGSDPAPCRARTESPTDDEARADARPAPAPSSSHAPGRSATANQDHPSHRRFHTGRRHRNPRWRTPWHDPMSFRDRSI